MGFTSFNFLIFFPLVALLYWLTPARLQWLILLLANYFFYINIKPVFALLLAAITLSTYLFTRLIDEADDESRKRNLMVINIILILLPLFFFKYFTSINNTIISLLVSAHIRWPLPEIKLLLPVGISFYTFVAIGYTVDVYNEKINAEKHLGLVALFLSFFPLILSGPIERATNLLPQFRLPRKLEYAMVVKGFKWVLWGYFMKLVVADRIGIYVDAIYAYIGEHNGTSLLFAAFLYPFQVYADLGGYSLIAIGAASLLGIKVIQNFNRPFFATSMSEFWRRWHISLISWLTDYVYTPLSFYFRRFGIGGIVISLLLTFMISGIWHGAAITYVAWGLMQGVFLSIEAVTRNNRIGVENKYHLTDSVIYTAICIGLTFILFAASQIFGRAPNLNDAFVIYKKIFTTHGPLFIGDPSTFLFILIGLPMLLIKDFTDEFTPSRFLFFESPHKAVRVLAYATIIVFILLIGVLDGGQFIYFKF
jgi:alginate O-acetyltransferase complex protein AlgI